jgi:hypothetical protein
MNGPSFAIKAIRPAIPLWLLFKAVQRVDVGWAVLVLLGRNTSLSVLMPGDAIRNVSLQSHG